jgi:hypothetical protein
MQCTRSASDHSMWCRWLRGFAGEKNYIGVFVFLFGVRAQFRTEENTKAGESAQRGVRQHGTNVTGHDAVQARARVESHPARGAGRSGGCPCVTITAVSFSAPRPAFSFSPSARWRVSSSSSNLIKREPLSFFNRKQSALMLPLPFSISASLSAVGFFHHQARCAAGCFISSHSALSFSPSVFIQSQAHTLPLPFLLSLSAAIVSFQLHHFAVTFHHQFSVNARFQRF